MHDLFWYGTVVGAMAVLLVRQAVLTWLDSRLNANRWRWRPGRYFRFHKARIVSTGQASMYACGGQILSEPYIRGWRIVIPITLDPHRILGEFNADQWMVYELPDDVIPASQIEVCTRCEYDRLDCDLANLIVYMRPPPPREDEESDEIEPSHNPLKD